MRNIIIVMFLFVSVNVFAESDDLYWVTPTVTNTPSPTMTPTATPYSISITKDLEIDGYQNLYFCTLCEHFHPPSSGCTISPTPTPAFEFNFHGDDRMGFVGDEVVFENGEIEIFDESYPTYSKLYAETAHFLENIVSVDFTNGFLLGMFFVVLLVLIAIILVEKG